MATDNARIARELLNAIAGHDFATATRLFAEDLVVHVGGISQLAGTYKSRDEFFGAMGKVEELTGGVTREVHDVTASDDHAVGLMHVAADKDGKRLTWNGASIMHIDDGQVTELWLVPDNPVAESEAFS